jgi:exopolyphosphatase/guanosine-5'-triphosphate,3'-diphosphate pyrophosphatase
MNSAVRIAPPLDLQTLLPALPQVDQAHSLHVTHLSLALYDALLQPLVLDAGGRALLGAAALWHDAGQVISERAHHKHSARLIMDLDLPRFGPWGKEQIACIARYHRKALPHPRHDIYGSLPAPAQERVRQLAAILRLADGLDYSHRGRVRFGSAALRSKALVLTVRAGPQAETEIGRAYEKADLFLDVFAIRLEIRREV